MSGVGQWVMVGAASDRAPAIGQHGRDHVSEVEPAGPRQLESGPDVILNLLRRARLNDRDKQVAKEKPGVGRHLRAFAPRIIANDNDRPAVGMGTGQIAQGQGVAGNVKPDAFHDRHGPQRGHLRAVDRRHRVGLVVRDAALDSPLPKQRRTSGDHIEES